MAVSSRYSPPPPPGIAPPALWGNPDVVRQRLGSAVEDIAFDSHSMLSPALSPQHFRANIERTAGPIIKLIDRLGATDPDALREFRREFDAIVAEYLRDNIVEQKYLLTRAMKC